MPFIVTIEIVFPKGAESETALHTQINLQFSLQFTEQKQRLIINIVDIQVFYFQGMTRMKLVAPPIKDKWNVWKPSYAMRLYTNFGLRKLGISKTRVMFY